ncbi:MAG: acyl-CoA thioesterase [Acutalibacteraceae bacterium]
MQFGELARTDFIKNVGISYSKMEEMGILLPLSELTCKYHQATLCEDEITIETRILALTPSRIQFDIPYTKMEWKNL